jgi:hypothetical protein
MQALPAESFTMLTKVYGGTSVLEGSSLCDACRYSRIIRGRRFEEEIVFCDASPMNSVRITFKVTSCTEYHDNREPSYIEFFEKAWILCPRSKRRAAGFVRAADLEHDEVIEMRLRSRDPK